MQALPARLQTHQATYPFLAYAILVYACCLFNCCLCPPLLQLADAPDCPSLAHAILVYAYYWYNFMPVARGTAACGYTTILALFWAAGMPITTRIPKDCQVRKQQT